MMSLPERDERGMLPAFAWPGGYPIVYVDNGDGELCADCASNNDCEPQAVGAFIHYDGPPVYCCDCNTEIPSAYGDQYEDSGE